MNKTLWQLWIILCFLFAGGALYRTIGDIAFNTTSNQTALFAALGIGFLLAAILSVCAMFLHGMYTLMAIRRKP